MILDVLENLRHYLALNSGFEAALPFLSRPDLPELPAQKYPIDGTRVYAIVERAQGRERAQARLEAHRAYTDIQLVMAGTDTMGWRSMATCQQPSGVYNADRDIQFFDDEPELWLPVQPGRFAIFFPRDAHMPLIADEPIHKVVVKVATA